MNCTKGYVEIPDPTHHRFLSPSQKVDFVLRRHRSLDVRSLLEQDLQLLRTLCLAPAASDAAAMAALGSIVANNPTDSSSVDDGEGDEDGDEERAMDAGVTATCWRLHVGVLLDVLRRVPASAGDSLAMVEHVALPCLGVLAALCLDGVDYPSFEEDDAAVPMTGAPPSLDGGAEGGSKRSSSNGVKLDEVVLGEVLRASAASWSSPPGSPPSPAAIAGCGGDGGGGGVEWTTPSQARNARLAHVGDEASPSSRFPEHWLLRLMTSRQSAVLRRFAGMVLGAMAAAKGPDGSEDMAEVAAHLLGCVGAEGSEAAALQVSKVGNVCVCLLLL